MNILDPRNQIQMRLHPEQRLLININNRVARLRDVTFRVAVLDHMHTMRICSGKIFIILFISQLLMK
jgi:hypothetical protein